MCIYVFWCFLLTMSYVGQCFVLWNLLAILARLSLDDNRCWIYPHRSRCCNLNGGSRKGSEGSLEPPLCPFWNILWKWNNLVYRDQLISFSWYIKKSEIKSAKRTPTPFKHINPLSRNPRSAPETWINSMFISSL